MRNRTTLGIIWIVEINKVYKMDALEMLKQMKDKEVDLIITDPPYGIGADKGPGMEGKAPTRHYDDKWDSQTPSQEVFNEILRVGKKVIIFGGNYFVDKLPKGTHWIMWDKIGNMGQFKDFSDAEMAWTNIKKNITKKYTVIQHGFIAEEKTRYHPTQKPVRLFIDIIKDYSNEGDLVMDPFCGSGTTAIACKKLGRDFICGDLEQKYVEITNKRISEKEFFYEIQQAEKEGKTIPQDTRKIEVNKGDIFILGNNKLMCGDSMSLIDVNKLLDGQTADMIFTDPPYGVNYIPEARRKGGRSKNMLGGIQGDQTTFPIKELMELIHTGICKGAVYMCHGTNQRDDMYEFVYSKFKMRPTDIIWVKNGFSILARDYHSAYEPIMYYYYPGKKFRGSRGQTDVWFFKRRSTGEYVHPTQKPVALIQRAIENSSDAGDIVLDLFGGSGSTMIACEHTNRRCYMMELDSHYIEVIIKRWESLTNQTAQKVNDLLKNPGV